MQDQRHGAVRRRLLTAVLDDLHGNVQVDGFGRAAAEFLATGVLIAQPDTGHEVRRLRFIAVEVAVQRQQHPHVLLCVAPASAVAVIEQTTHQFGDQVAVGLIGHQRIEQHGVGAAVGMEQQVFAIVVAIDEVGRARGFADPVVEVAADQVDLRLRRRVTGEGVEQPADAFQREVVEAADVNELPRLDGVHVA